MNFKKILILTFAFLLLLSFTACGSKENKVNENDPLYGEWAEVRIPEDGFGTTYEFYGNGEGEYRTLDMVNYFAYTYDDEKIYMDVRVTDPPIRRVYDYKIEGNKITLGYTNDSGEYKEVVCNKK